MKITYLGHAALAIDINGKIIVVDPFITANPKAAHLSVDEIQADYILLTHAHGDHVLDAEQIARRTGAIIVSNAEIAAYFENKNLKTHSMNHGGSWHFDFGKVKYVTALHSSSFPDGTYGGNPGGFVIESHKSVYIAGDTALTFDMKLIPLRTKLDLAILPIGDNYTMDVDDAIIASDFLGCDRVLGYHYDTFGFITINQQEAIQKFAAKNKSLLLLDIGAAIDL